MAAVPQPSGTVSLVFTDVEGSTRLLEELGAEAYRDALGQHRRIVREACARFSGYEVDYEGDAFFYAFQSAADAVGAVAAFMAGLEGGPIRLRVGVHTGEPIMDPPKYVGMDVHRAARIMSAAHGGQVVLSRETVALLPAGNDQLPRGSEHLLPALVGDLAALAAACPTLTLLVTSRERLQIAVETSWPVPALAPDEAVALFLVRASDVGVVLEDDEVVRELCRRLDELPLALELAAARTVLLSPAQLLERLGRRLDLLKGPRDADPRQQTLRATIEWSYGLLDGEERRVYRTLGVFAGGCTLEAAEQVAAADLDVVQSLLDKSLLRRHDEAGDGRLWMPPANRRPRSSRRSPWHATQLSRPGRSTALGRTGTPRRSHPRPPRLPRMASPASDLRAWVALLEKEGELVRVSAEVDPDLEITEITDRVVKAHGPALLFENVRGSRLPLLINQFGSERRMCLAFGVERLDDLADRLGEILELQPPQGLVDKVRSLGKLKSIAGSMPKEVTKAPCQEVVLTGDEVNLDLLPIMRCWPLDPAPFITLPAVITKDRQTGVRNVGMYRMQKIDRRSTFMHWQIHKDGRADLLAAPDGKIPVAVALGLDPVTAYSASAPLPKQIGELMVAGFLKGSPVQLVKCRTVDLEVPANAEIVLEGWVDRGDVGIEGPFGDHTGFYTPPEEFPVFRISAMTMRRDAIYPSIVVGKPPAEDEWLAKATERIFLPAIRMSVPEIVDYDLPTAGTFHNCVIVSIRKRFPGHAKKVMHAMWGLGLMSLTKSVVVVDEHVDVHDYEQVFFYVCANVDPARDVVLSAGPIDQLDHATTLQAYGGKIGFDATSKSPAEGAREWPPEIEMDAETKARVDARWAELALPGAPSGAAVQNEARARALTQLLRR